jgi:hypothetical protein
VTWALIVQQEADLADPTHNFILRRELCEPRRMIVTLWWFHAILRDAPDVGAPQMKAEVVAHRIKRDDARA